MPRRRSATLQFNAITLVGGLLPASLLEQIALQQAPGQKAGDYGLPKNQRLQVAVDQAWNRAKALWQEAQELRRRGTGTPLGGLVQPAAAATGVRLGRPGALPDPPDRGCPVPDHPPGLQWRGAGGAHRPDQRRAG